MIRRQLLVAGWSLGDCAIVDVGRSLRTELRHAEGRLRILALHADPTVPRTDRRAVLQRAYAQRLAPGAVATYLLGDVNFAAAGGQRIDICEVATTERGDSLLEYWSWTRSRFRWRSRRGKDPDSAKFGQRSAKLCRHGADPGSIRGLSGVHLEPIRGRSGLDPESICSRPRADPEPIQGLSGVDLESFRSRIGGRGLRLLSHRLQLLEAPRHFCALPKVRLGGNLKVVR